MNIQTLLHNFAFDVQEGMSDDQIGERAAGLANEIEALVRKETVEEILKSTRTVIKDCFEVEEIFVGDIREYAKANGINL